MNNYFCKSCSGGGQNNCGCKPAQYNGMFNIEVAPYDPLTWLVTWNGFTSKVRVPQSHETDTAISTDQSNATLNYKAESHKDTITGAQLGELIKLNDLRNVDFDSSLAGTCYDLVYRKYGSCGEGCTSIQNKWYNFNPNSDGAKQSYLRYVRGTNAYGCPEFLSEPSDTSQYWFAGWKGNNENQQFGYYQATTEDELPDGASIVYISGNNKSLHCAPLKSASSNLYQSYHRGNDMMSQDYYYAATASYDLHIAPNSHHGQVIGATGASSDSSCSNLNQDVIAIVHWCSDHSYGSDGQLVQMTPYHSGESWTTDMEDQRAIHFEATANTAMPTSTSLKIPAGRHLVLHVHGDSGNSGNFRVHQFSITWLPANLLSSVNEIIQ